MRKKIVVSSKSGFCFGVQRALGIAQKALKSGFTVYSLGPIIHNPQVVEEFSKKGLKVVRNIGAVKVKKGLKFLIPSHGLDPGKIRGRKFDCVDTTCPFVERVHDIVKDLKKKGFYIIIVGDRRHPEVKGLKGIAGEKSSVVLDKAEVKALKFKAERVSLISQTTAPLSSFKEILSEIAKKDFTELVSFNTVCKNTIERINEAEKIAKRVDAMIVIGGKESANTTKLANACKKANPSTYHVEDGNDLKIKCFKNKKRIGIATGASTPPYAVREVIEKIRRFDK